MIAQAAGLPACDLSDGGILGRAFGTDVALASLSVQVATHCGVMCHRAQQSGSDQRRPPLPSSEQGSPVGSTGSIGEEQIGFAVPVPLDTGAEDLDQPAGQRDGPSARGRLWVALELGVTGDLDHRADNRSQQAFRSTASAQSPAASPQRSLAPPETATRPR